METSVSSEEDDSVESSLQPEMFFFFACLILSTSSFACDSDFKNKVPVSGLQELKDVIGFSRQSVAVGLNAWPLVFIRIKILTILPTFIVELDSVDCWPRYNTVGMKYGGSRLH